MTTGCALNNLLLESAGNAQKYITHRTPAQLPDLFHDVFFGLGESFELSH
jgi:hypothetical protein